MQISQEPPLQLQNLVIPETISEQKKHQLYLNILSTISGIHREMLSIFNLILWIIPTVILIILKFTHVQYYIMTPVIGVLCAIVALVFHILNNKKHLWHCYVFSVLFGYVWAHHVYYCNHQYQLQLVILSLVSFVTSIGTVCFMPVQEVFSSTLYVEEFSVYSVRYVRLLMLLPGFIIQLIWDYGAFLQPQGHTNHIMYNNNSNESHIQSRHSYYLRLILSLAFITWIFGYISNIYNVYYYIINNINRFLFGDENKATLKKAVIGMLMNSVPVGVYVADFAQGRITEVQPGNRYLVLLVGATVTSIGQFGVEWFINTRNNNSNNNYSNSNKVNIKRTILTIIIQLLICGILIIILLLCTFPTPYTLKTLCIIDISLFILITSLNHLSLPRTFFGLQSPIFSIFNSHYFRYLQHIIFRLMFGLIIVVISKMLLYERLYEQLRRNIVEVDMKFVQYFFVPFLVYRSFKRAITQGNKLGGHVAVLICLLLLYVGDQSVDQSMMVLSAMLTVLFFPPLPDNFGMSYVSLFTTPKKLTPKYNFMYSIIYFMITSVNVCIMILSIGTLQFSMLFGLPVFICTIPNIVQIQQLHPEQQAQTTSKQHSLYSKIYSLIPPSLFLFLPHGHYLIRISKYILLIQIKQQNYLFSQLIDIKGLQVQEVTSCHSKQADTVDKIVEETWGNLYNNKGSNCDVKAAINYLATVLMPMAKCVVSVPTENQIKLTGVVQSAQFLLLFKQALLKSLCVEVFKIKYTPQQLLQADQIIDDLSAICKKDKFEKLFPRQFAEEIGLKVKYPQNNSKNNFNHNKIVNVVSSISNNKVKLPPINKNKKQFVNDFMDLLQSSMNDKKQDKQDNIVIQQKQHKQTSTHQLLGSQIKINHIKNTMQQASLSLQINHNSNKIANINPISTANILQLNLALIMSLYHYSIGKFDYLNIKKFYNLLKMQKDQLTQIKFHNSLEILSKALGAGFKIAVDKMTMGENEIGYDDFQEYQKNSFLGTHGTALYNQAVLNDKPDIWTVSYTKGQLSINRLAKSQNDLYMFKADSHIIKSIWNNLKFQLVYATNDNDQRYSIQTHASLLRNLWTEACEEPFGYPSYHKKDVMN